LLKRLAILLSIMLWPGLAQAQVDALSPSSFSGLLDLRASAAGGERSWLAGGFGKTRVSGDDARFDIGEADLAWRPHFGFDWSAVVEGEIQPDHDHGVRIGEAYLKYKPLIADGWRASARAGLFYPPISLEHGGPFWTPTETITPSAINSWVGEEVKVGGLEAAVSHDLGEQSVGATLAVFGFNDTAGTLMAVRGWSLDDVRTNASGRYALPQLNDFLEYVQPPQTTPVIDIDHRIGVYGRLDWSPTSRLALNAVYYDNNADPTAENANDLWAWRTQFLNLGAVWQIDDKTRLLSQAMTGRTRMGYATPEIWVNTTFTAGYVLLTRAIGEDSVTGRADVFSTANHTDAYYGLTEENGWALTADYRKHLTDHVSGLVEVLHVESNRPGRTDVLGEASMQRQTVMQAALRLSF
jgi:hypothetical protein